VNLKKVGLHGLCLLCIVGRSSINEKGVVAVRKVIVLSMFLFVAISAPSMGFSALSPQYAPAVAADDGMAKMQLVIKKLRSSMTSMKDFDELEKAGMSKKDVDRMRRAMQQKINQMTEEAVDLIRTL